MKRSKRILEELDQDIREHIERETQDNIERGMTAEEARYAAMRKFGNVTRVKEETREVWSLVWLERLLQDVKYGLRMLRKSPAFAVVGVLTLALGIGANTAIFSVVDAVLFRGLPYRDAERLVWATNVVRQQGQNLVFADEYAGWRTQSHVFETIAAYSAAAEYTLTGAGSPERLRGARATASFLEVLGVTPQLGRNFMPEEDRPGGPKVALLSNAIWKSNFGADPKVIGRVVALDDAPYTVIGVLPRDFEFLDNSPADILVPFQLAESSIQASNGRVMVMIQPLSVVARLRAGATVESAVSELDAINKRVLENLPAHIKGLGDGQAQVFLLHDHEIGNVRPALLILLGAVGFVLLIACANVANLQLARAAAREKEVAVRGALGAGRWRLAMLLLTESAVVALAGGVAGLLMADGVLRLIHRYGPANIPHLQGARLDLRVLVFTLAVSLLTGILFGLAPVLAAFRVPLNNTLKESGPQSGSGTGTRRAQRALMVAEIALSFVLFIGAGLLVKSFHQLTAIQTGFDPHGVLTARVALPLDQYQSVELQRAFFEQLVGRFQAVPGVASAGATASIPLRGNVMISTIMMEGQAPTELNMENVPTARINAVTPGYFAALRVPLIEGRLLDERDGANAPNAVVVNQAFVRRYFEKEDPIGKGFTAGLGGAGPGGPKTWRIVGVIGDTKQRGLAGDIMPEATASALQWPRFMMTLVLRTSVEPLSLVSAVREQVSGLDKNLPLYGVQTMDDVLSAEVASQRFNAGAIAGFAGLAVLLAGVGIYGVMAYAVSQRTREMGVRIALGAGPRNVLGMVLNQGLRLALIGVALGLAASFGLTRLMSGLLFGVKPTDPETFVLVTVALLAVALAACWIPARRATRVDPIVALRYE
jgi:predicted permease